MMIKIRLAGFVGQHLVIDGVHTECGKIVDGIGIRIDNNAGGVMSWEDFEAAYLEVKRLRELPESAEELLSRAEFS